MSLAALDASFDSWGEAVQGGEGEMRSAVWGLLASWHTSQPPFERRHDQRFAYPQLVTLRPVGPDGLAVGDASYTVVTKQLSERGIGFYHPQPLVARRVIATFDIPEQEPVAFLVDVTWCRFTRQGWYESGGRLLHAVPHEPACR